MSLTDSIPPPRSVDDCLTALANQRRRFLLYYLREHGDATLEELTDVVAGWLAAQGGAEADCHARERTAIALRHVHLPRLVDAHFVEYDRATGVVALGPYPTWVDDVLDLTFRIEATEERARSLRDLLGE